MDHTQLQRAAHALASPYSRLTIFTVDQMSITVEALKRIQDNVVKALVRGHFAALFCEA